VLVIESTQPHAIIEDTETCFTLPAAMGEGGGHIPMIIEEKNAESDRVSKPGSASRFL